MPLSSLTYVHVLWTVLSSVQSELLAINGEMVPVPRDVTCHGNKCGNGGIAPCILNLNTRSIRVANLMLQPIYRNERTPGTSSTGVWVGPRFNLVVKTLCFILIFPE
jgi:hypothetical protein